MPLLGDLIFYMYFSMIVMKLNHARNLTSVKKMSTKDCFLKHHLRYFNHILTLKKLCSLLLEMLFMVKFLYFFLRSLIEEDIDLSD